MGCFWLVTCQGPADGQEFDLCDCQVWDRGQRDMELSQKCLDACVEAFGAELVGMEAWFDEHCNPQDPKPNTHEEMAHR